jgi:serine/threonine-protein kinase
VNNDEMSGIWIYDIRRDTMAPLTGERNAGQPVWTPDGKYIVYRGATGISGARADGGGKAQSLTENKELQYPTSFSPDGKHLVFHQMGLQGFDLWILPVEYDENGLKAGKAEFFLRTSNGGRDAHFSPDGRWIAYSSSESGSPQVYVSGFPDTGRHWQVSSNGGLSPIFSRNGKQLFYFDVLGNQIMVASYAVKGDSLVVEKPQVWSRQSVALSLSGAVGAQYDVAPDGKRMVVSTYASSAQQGSGHVILLENFIDELQRKMPSGFK